ncbi:MAG: type I-E CRISPR-associated endonuclease Cas1 [Firmicutes bacterium]|nr:type I-E CRISPR-associated endonuclease Cas1 [Bacillota bacterium]
MGLDCCQWRRLENRKLKDLHILPKVRDGWSYLYIEHCRIDQQGKAIVLHDTQGSVPVPCAALALLMLGPGTSITHAAVSALADNGCLAVWCGEEGVRFYAQGMGETRNAANFLHQARLWADAALHLLVVRRMYQARFQESLDPGLNIQQIRGLEGVRVREAYALASRETGLRWKGRSYNRQGWGSADPINRALSTANSCLYGICHAAIVSAGYAPALGFIHTGKMLSFVYDIADLYKTDVSIPIAFQETAKGEQDLEKRVRYACRDAYKEVRLLDRLIPDIQEVLAIPDTDHSSDYDTDDCLPGNLWDPKDKDVRGGQNFSDGPSLPPLPSSPK